MPYIYFIIYFETFVKPHVSGLRTCLKALTTSSTARTNDVIKMCDIIHWLYKPLIAMKFSLPKFYCQLPKISAKSEFGVKIKYK